MNAVITDPSCRWCYTVATVNHSGELLCSLHAVEMLGSFPAFEYAHGWGAA